MQAAYGFAQESGTALSRHRCWSSRFFEGRCHSQHHSYDRQNMRRWLPSVTYNMIVENVVPSSAVPSQNRKRWSIHDKPTWDTVVGGGKLRTRFGVCVSTRTRCPRLAHRSPAKNGFKFVDGGLPSMANMLHHESRDGGNRSETGLISTQKDFRRCVALQVRRSRTSTHCDCICST